ncbi:hypothetical protein H9P43_005180 [Blastocladiella emersonii ATCC 22665]|nr:hypothetical protein H9P43_005180 [Blastocladiella emersonii ATCC 22665]
MAHLHAMTSCARALADHSRETAARVAAQAQIGIYAPATGAADAPTPPPPPPPPPAGVSPIGTGAVDAAWVLNQCLERGVFEFVPWLGGAPPPSPTPTPNAWQLTMPADAMHTRAVRGEQGDGWTRLLVPVAAAAAPADKWKPRRAPSGIQPGAARTELQALRLTPAVGAGYLEQAEARAFAYAGLRDPAATVTQEEVEVDPLELPADLQPDPWSHAREPNDDGDEEDPTVPRDPWRAAQAIEAAVHEYHVSRAARLEHAEGVLATLTPATARAVAAAGAGAGAGGIAAAPVPEDWRAPAIGSIMRARPVTGPRSGKPGRPVAHLVRGNE